MMEHFTIGIISYLMGSIPFGLILTKVFLKKNIRDIGSGNIGATNALRTGNKLIGYSTLILDISKAIIPVIYVKINFPELIFIASLCAFLGHVFPVWLKFKGGKGVATYVGILFSINVLLGTIFIISWMVIFMFTKYSSLSSIIGTISIPVYLLLTGQSNNVIFFIIMFVLIFFTHRENIKRLKNKEESKTKIY
ncbi:glycerol-3-phosphate 1-O-acyltransferase PlsY [Candidatus Pelagibacter sp.]|mgnify:FL=1|jgi:acyl phosphate:glycerol-3-phosphate acyltransferase|nr:glycerol-3-phosphate 1-O-acyltransferase PlsY [Candidatus Pelagibacter sp.]|tara:strand:- start:3 stop:584 length:582 start_codon:yes stop_codon:yes gene_type:complete